MTPNKLGGQAPTTAMRSSGKRVAEGHNPPKEDEEPPDKGEERTFGGRRRPSNERLNEKVWNKPSNEGANVRSWNNSEHQPISEERSCCWGF